jgi:hypothetical protein
MGLDDRLVEWANERDWNHIEQDDYEDQDEHWYIVSDWYDGENLETFKMFRDFIEENGQTDIYNGKTFTYVELGEWKYWITASYYSNGLCLNRREY